MIDETLHRITPLAQDWLERAAALSRFDLL